MCKFTQALFNCNHTALYTEPMHTALCKAATNFNICQGRTTVPAPCFPLLSDANNHSKIAATYRLFTACPDCQYTEADVVRVRTLEAYAEECLETGRELIELWESDVRFPYVVQIILHNWLQGVFSARGEKKFHGLFMGDLERAEECLRYLQACVDLESEYAEGSRQEFLRDIAVAERILELGRMKLDCCVEVMRLVDQGCIFGTEMEEVGDRLEALVCANLDGADDLEEGEIASDGALETAPVSDPELYNTWASTSKREYVDPYLDRWLGEMDCEWRHGSSPIWMYVNERKVSTSARRWKDLTIDIPPKRKAGLPKIETSCIISTSYSNSIDAL